MGLWFHFPDVVGRVASVLMRLKGQLQVLAVVTGFGAHSLHADLATEPQRTFGLGDLQSVAVSSDRRHLASAGRSGIYLWDFEEGLLRARLPSEGGTTPALAFSPDGKVLLSAGDSRVIRAWETETGSLIREFAGHQGAIQDLEFATDGSVFVSASADNTARVWALETGNTLGSVTVPGAFINAAVFTPDGKGLVTSASTMGDRIQLWDLATETITRTFPDPAWHVSGLGFVRSGHLISAGDDLVARVWDIETGEVVRTLEGASLFVTGMATSIETRVVMVGCGDGRVIAWDSETGEIMEEYEGDSMIGFCGIPGVGWAITAGSDNKLRLLDLTSSEALRTLEGHTTSATLGVSLSPDGKYVLSGGAEASTRLWSRTNGALVRTYEGHGGGTATAMFAADGTRVLTTRGHPQPMVQLWNTETGVVEGEYGWTSGWPMCAAVSGNGQWVVAGDQNGKVRLWDVEAGGNPRTFTGRAGIVASVAISSDGTRLASGGSSFRPVVDVWDRATGASLHTFEVEAGSVTALDFSPDGGELLAAWEDGYVRIYDLETGEIEREIVTPAAFLNDAVFSPDGRHILVGEGWPMFTARLYDRSTGRVLRVFAGHQWSVDSVAFDASGTAVLTGSDTVRLWDIRGAVAGLRMERVATGLELRWDLGTLQQAADPGGPWLDLNGATSPWPVPAEGLAGFFRVKVLDP